MIILLYGFRNAHAMIKELCKQCNRYRKTTYKRNDQLLLKHFINNGFMWMHLHIIPFTLKMIIKTFH